MDAVSPAVNAFKFAKAMVTGDMEGAKSYGKQLAMDLGGDAIMQGVQGMKKIVSGDMSGFRDLAEVALAVTPLGASPLGMLADAGMALVDGFKSGGVKGGLRAAADVAGFGGVVDAGISAKQGYDSGGFAGGVKAGAMSCMPLAMCDPGVFKSQPEMLAGTAVAAGMMASDAGLSLPSRGSKSARSGGCSSTSKEQPSSPVEPQARAMILEAPSDRYGNESPKTSGTESRLEIADQEHPDPNKYESPKPGGTESRLEVADQEHPDPNKYESPSFSLGLDGASPFFMAAFNLELPVMTARFQQLNWLEEWS